jgi:hypothetical protein
VALFAVVATAVAAVMEWRTKETLLVDPRRFESHPPRRVDDLTP